MARSKQGAGVEMRHLHLMTAIVEYGTLTAAGRALGLTQPALSHQLRELESRLRTPLFERTAKRMVLTPPGEQLAHVAREILSQVGAFHKRLSDDEFFENRGTIRVATECYTAYHWLPPVFRAFRERWPKVELRFAPEHTATALSALREGSLDLAVVYNRPTDRRIRFERLFDDEVVLVVGRDHRLADESFVPVDAVAEEHLFTYSALERGSSAVRDILESAGVEPLKTTRLQLTEAILELVAAGFGIAILAKWAIAPHLKSGSVRAVRLGKQGHHRTWYSAVRSGDITTAYQTDLANLLRRHLGSAGRTASL
jgi:LysR family transcriptional regulator for metE and metH